MVKTSKYLYNKESNKEIINNMNVCKLLEIYISAFAPT